MDHKEKRFNEYNFLDVDCTACRMAMDGVSLSRWYWSGKFESGMCATDKMMKIWKKRVIDNFPHCNVPCEILTHIMTLKSKGSVATWDTLVEGLKAWLDKNSAFSDISRLIIRSWHNGRHNRKLHLYNILILT